VKDPKIKKKEPSVLLGLSGSSKEALVELLYADIVLECNIEFAFEFERGWKIQHSTCNICKSQLLAANLDVRIIVKIH
jgi:hypothetical protein